MTIAEWCLVGLLAAGLGVAIDLRNKVKKQNDAAIKRAFLKMMANPKKD